MSFIYRQLNKDYAYWTEKRRLGQDRGGNVSGLLSQVEDGRVVQNVLFDCGLGTLEAIADFCPDSFWEEPLVVFITHGHIDHHAELMVLSEIYCQRRGDFIRNSRPPVPVYATDEAQQHLLSTHRYGYTSGETLEHRRIESGSAVSFGPFNVLPLTVDHGAGSVIYSIEFAGHRIVIAWDLRTPPLQHLAALCGPSLALIEGTTLTAMAEETGHAGLAALVDSGFLTQLELNYDPAAQCYGGYLVHYSGWEDPWGALTDIALKHRIDTTYPELTHVLRVAARGQTWTFDSHRKTNP
ncbi:MAG: hypothetical protein J5I90_20995 [Caldilineales bacterium]|nr:hypothetical protein [Caldilineales bacterium]